MEQLNKKTIVIFSLWYKFIERISFQGISFIVQIVLARLLTPSDYGTLALLIVFISISQVFVQGGMTTALIQRKDVDKTDFSSVFYLSLGIAASFYGILFFAAPFIALYYNVPILTKVLRVLALILFPGAFNSIQNAKVARDMQFKKLMYSSIGAVTISGIVGIVMAYMDYGVWALVGQQLTNQFAVCIMMWFTVKWRPKLLFSFKRIKILFSFGWNLLLSGLIDTIYNNLQSLVIGKKYTSAMLGFYNRGKQFPELMINSINGSIQSVMLPTLSSEQDNKLKMKYIMRQSIVMSSYLVFPTIVGLAVTADPLISLMLKDKWLPCVPYLRIYCASFALYPIHTANLQAINAQGRSDIFLRLEIIKKFYACIILIITVVFFQSPIAIAVGTAVSSIISSFVNAVPNKKLLQYTYGEQIRDVLPPLIISVLMGIAVYPITFWGLSNGITILLQVIAGVLVYILLSILFMNEAFYKLFDMLKGYLNIKRFNSK